MNIVGYAVGYKRSNRINTYDLSLFAYNAIEVKSPNRLRTTLDNDTELLENLLFPSFYLNFFYFLSLSREKIKMSLYRKYQKSVSEQTRNG